MSSPVATDHRRRPRHQRRSSGRWPRAWLTRPEIGAVAAAIAIFIFFFAIAPPFRTLPSFSTVLYASSTIGIVAVGVALLMIGGEFDLSSGVSVVTSALAAALLTFQLGLNMWVGVLVSACSSRWGSGSSTATWSSEPGSPAS